MACTTDRSEQIAALAAGRIAAAQAEDLLEHLDGCRQCSQELDAVADLVAAGERDPGLLAGAGDAPRRRLWLTLAAAAALVATALLWQPFARPPTLRELASIDALLAPGDLTLRAGVASTRPRSPPW